MKKHLLLALILTLGASPVLAASQVTPITSTNSSTIAVGSTSSTIYSDVFEIKDPAQKYVISYKANSVTLTPSLTIELEQSFQRPTTANQTDTTWSTVATVDASFQNKTKWFHKSVTPVGLPFGRLKIIGALSNSTDSTLEAKLTRQY